MVVFLISCSPKMYYCTYSKYKKWWLFLYRVLVKGSLNRLFFTVWPKTREIKYMNLLTTVLHWCISETMWTVNVNSHLYQFSKLIRRSVSCPLPVLCLIFLFILTQLLHVQKHKLTSLNRSQAVYMVISLSSYISSLSNIGNDSNDNNNTEGSQQAL